ncbi:MAG: hypothetical protein IJ759_07955 [Bacteroidales bacterium]|nr:hypothetical protein [Bacteroidales bacterium]
MRKVLVVLASVITMCSCEIATEENSKNDEVYNGALKFNTYKYNGHTYIRSCCDSYFLHDPDCVCRTSNDGLSDEE